MTADRMDIGPITLTRHTEEEVIAAVISHPSGLPTLSVVTPNIYHLHLAREHGAVAAAIRDADISIPDGWPIAFLSRRLHADRRGRMAGSDISMRIIEEAATEGLSLLVVGGSDQSLTAAYSVLRRRYPALRLVEPTRNLSLPTVPTDESLDEFVTILNEATADITLLCVGAPKSELHVAAARHALRTRAILCVGATVDFISGYKVRAPKWLQSLGLEWVFRLIQEPRRLVVRYWNGARAFMATWADEQRNAHTEPLSRDH